MKTFIKTNSKLSIVLLITILQAFPVYSQTFSELNDAGDLIWADEFDGTGEPDPSKWEQMEYNRKNNDEGPDGWWSKEDAYLDGNGNLIIRVRRIEDKNADGDSCDFSVGAVRTKGKFEQLYGRFEIRCKLPTQPGWWVDYWMMQGDVGAVGNGGEDGTEVDIMEAFGWTNRIHQTFHWDGYGSDHRSTGRTFYPDGVQEGFHTYSLEWYPEKYIFFIDGEETWRTDGGGVCNKAGYLKVTGEISTKSWAMKDSWANHPSNAVFPDSFVVDYVRVYELGEYENRVAVQSIASQKPYSVYPNPAVDQISIMCDDNQRTESVDISIINSLGQTVKSIEQVQLNTQILVNNLPNGFYCIAIERKGEMDYLRFIKE